MDIPVGLGCSEGVAVPDVGGDDWCHGVMWVVKSLLTQERECSRYPQETARFMGNASI